MELPPAAKRCLNNRPLPSGVKLSTVKLDRRSRRWWHDAYVGLTHTLVVTAGNVTQAHALLHGDKVAALGDAGYQGVKKRDENQGKAVTWHVAMKRSLRKALPTNRHGRKIEKLEHIKASVRAKVEHPFHVVMNLFRHRKGRYRGLEKNTAQLFTLFGLANLVLAGRRFKITETRVAS